MCSEPCTPAQLLLHTAPGPCLKNNPPFPARLPTVSAATTTATAAPPAHPPPQYTYLQPRRLQPHVLIAGHLLTALSNDGARRLQLARLLLKARSSNPAGTVVGVGGDHTLEQQPRLVGVWVGGWMFGGQGGARASDRQQRQTAPGGGEGGRQQAQAADRTGGQADGAHVRDRCRVAFFPHPPSPQRCP